MNFTARSVAPIAEHRFTIWGSGYKLVDMVDTVDMVDMVRYGTVRYDTMYVVRCAICGLQYVTHGIYTICMYTLVSLSLSISLSLYIYIYIYIYTHLSSHGNTHNA